MTVKEYALSQLHWIVRKDPWVRDLFLAAGASLDQMAERIVAIWNFDDFSALTAEQCAYYEGLLGLPTDPATSLADRRAAIQAAWNGGQPATLEAIQSACDAWEAGGIACSYEPGTLTLDFIGTTGIPANLDTLKKTIEAMVPAHIIVEYAFSYLLIRDIHLVKTLTEMEALTLDQFAGA